jgi:hypothetical protein
LKSYDYHAGCATGVSTLITGAVLMMLVSMCHHVNAGDAQTFGYTITNDLTKADPNTIWTNGDASLESELGDPKLAKAIAKGWADEWKFSVNSGRTIALSPDQIDQEGATQGKLRQDLIELDSDGKTLSLLLRARLEMPVSLF